MRSFKLIKVDLNVAHGIDGDSSKRNFLILSTEDDEIVYVKLHHIKSVSKTGSPEDKKD